MKLKNLRYCQWCVGYSPGFGALATATALRISHFSAWVKPAEAAFEYEAVAEQNGAAVAGDTQPINGASAEESSKHVVERLAALAEAARPRRIMRLHWQAPQDRRCYLRFVPAKHQLFPSRLSIKTLPLKTTPFLLSTALCLLLCLGLGREARAQSSSAASLPIIPQPVRVRVGGAPFVLTSGTRVYTGPGLPP
ncbi:MAG: hypothetical protein EOO62_09490, partial [Hymenobacter sp.]